MDTTSNLLRPMSIGDILDESVNLYRKNFRLFIGISAWVYVPLCFLSLVISQTSYNLLSQIISIFLSAVVTIAISERILGREISVSSSYRRISGMLISFIGAMLLVALLALVMLVGIILISTSFATILRFLRLPLTISGLILMMLVGVLALIILVWFLFVPQAVLLEKIGAGKSIGRSMDLAKSSFWKILAVLILVSIAMFLAGNLLALIGGIIMTLSGSDLRSIENITTSIRKFQKFPLIIGITSLFLQPFRMIVITLLYYDIRVRKEAYDTQLMAEELAIEIDNDEDSNNFQP